MIAEMGVCDAGFSTTGHPAAMAGAILWATRFSGKLNGLMAPTTPTGRRRVKPSLPSPTSDASSGTISPARRRASTAANVNVDTARFASTRAVLIGLAASSAMMRANCSVRSDSSCAARSRISARFHAGNGPARCTASAVATARSTSAALHAGTRSISWPSYGDRTTISSPVVVSVVNRSSPIGSFRMVLCLSLRTSTQNVDSARRRVGGEFDLAVEDLLEQGAVSGTAPQISSSGSSRARMRRSTSEGVTMVSSP